MGYPLPPTFRSHDAGETCDSNLRRRELFARLSTRVRRPARARRIGTREREGMHVRVGHGEIRYVLRVVCNVRMTDYLSRTTRYSALHANAPAFKIPETDNSTRRSPPPPPYPRRRAQRRRASSLRRQSTPPDAAHATWQMFEAERSAREREREAMRGGRGARRGICATPSILVSNSRIIEGSRAELGNVAARSTLFSSKPGEGGRCDEKGERSG